MIAGHCHNNKGEAYTDFGMYRQLSPDANTLAKFIDPLYDYINETETRVAISDWYDTVTGRKIGFMARSVIGGHWMPLFAAKQAKKTIVIHPTQPIKFIGLTSESGGYQDQIKQKK